MKNLKNQCWHLEKLSNSKWIPLYEDKEVSVVIDFYENYIKPFLHPEERDNYRLLCVVDGDVLYSL